jgi:hypothetical protein
VCERYGLEPGSPDEAFNSKTRYVMRHLEKFSDARVFAIAKSVIEDFSGRQAASRGRTTGQAGPPLIGHHEAAFGRSAQ